MSFGLSKNLTQRIISALSLLPIVLGLIYLGGWWFFALLAGGGALMVKEWQALTDCDKSSSGLAAFAFAILPSAVVTSFGTAISAVAIASFILLLSALLAMVPPKKLALNAGRAASAINHAIGGAYVSLALVSLAWLRAQDEHGLLVLWLFFAVWAMDVGGYFAGKGIGGPKLAPVISPKKTWAGLAGGMVLAALVSLAISLIFELGDPLLMPFAAALVAVVAQLGDLYESAVKRAMDKKDSGSLIPGHGGILDRVDGLVFAAPFVVFAFVVPELARIAS